MIVDEAKNELVEALQHVFNSHMKAQLGSAYEDQDRGDFIEVNNALRKTKNYLEEGFKDVFEKLGIDDTGLILILTK